MSGSWLTNGIILDDIIDHTQLSHPLRIGESMWDMFQSPNIPDGELHWLPFQHTITALNQRLSYRTFRILNMATNIFITSAGIWTRNYTDKNNGTYMLNIFNAQTNFAITTRLWKELLWLKINVIWSSDCC